MAQNLSAEQVKEAYVKAMPPSFGEHFNSLYNSVCWLNSKWNDFRSLYTEQRENVALMNQISGAFFSDLQKMFWESVLMHLCRLTDPPKTGGHENLSLPALVDLIHDVRDPKFRASVRTAVESCVKKTEFARVWRNKRLAHMERPLAGGMAATSLPASNEKDIQSAIDAIADAMNLIEQQYMKSTVMYNVSLDIPFGVQSLLHYLKKGLAAQQAEDAAARM